MNYTEKIRKAAKKDFQEAYDLGYKHGKEIGRKEYQLELLREELKRKGMQV